MEIHNIFHKIKDHEPTVLGSEHLRKFAVLLPVMEKNGEPHVLFEVRSSEMRRQPERSAFPAGKSTQAMLVRKRRRSGKRKKSSASMPDACRMSTRSTI